jgi:hypothetical protein
MYSFGCVISNVEGLDCKEGSITEPCINLDLDACGHQPKQEFTSLENLRQFEVLFRDVLWIMKLETVKIKT